MSNKSIGKTIYNLRKNKGLTQQDLAHNLKVSDKTISKWERNLEMPDVKLIPKLAEELDITIEELLDVDIKNNNKTDDIVNIILICIGIAMGICIIVSSILKQLDVNSAFTMLGIGLTSISFYLLKNKEN